MLYLLWIKLTQIRNVFRKDCPHSQSRKLFFNRILMPNIIRNACFWCRNNLFKYSWDAAPYNIIQNEICECIKAKYSKLFLMLPDAIMLTFVLVKTSFGIVAQYGGLNYYPTWVQEFRILHLFHTVVYYFDEK